jgi:LysR family glycine cleavage system transcriptional activator
MAQSLPSLNALRVFEAAARHLSFSKAAEELHVTPAAVSHQVKTLEDQLGVVLFHRLNRGLALTDAALTGLPQLQKAFCAMTKAVSSMRGAEDSHLLMVEVAPSFAAKWLLPRLPRFAGLRPDIDLRIAASLAQIDAQLSNTDIRGDFRSGETNLAIRFGGGNYPGCRVDLLFTVEAVPLCSPALLAGPPPLKTPQDLASHVLLHDDTPYEGQPTWEAWLDAAGASGVAVNRGLHVNSMQMVLQAAADGQGVALSIEALAADDIAAGRLVIPFDVRLPLSNAYYVVSLEETADLPRVAAFRDWILGEAERFRKESVALSAQRTGGT